MVTLSPNHLQEIAPFSELIELVRNNSVENENIENFARLCVINNCAQSFTELLPHTSYAQSPLTILACFNAVEIAQKLHVSTRCSHKWARAARRAAKAGHMEFVQYIRTRIDSQKIRKAAVSGACMGDHVEIVKTLLPTIEEPLCRNQLPHVAAAHDAFKCMSYLLDGMNGPTWMEVFTLASVNNNCALLKLMLDGVPSDIEVPSEWAIKVALRNHQNHKVLCFVFEHITLEDITRFRPNVHPHIRDNLLNAYQHTLLSAATSDVQNTSSKRKM